MRCQGKEICDWTCTYSEKAWLQLPKSVFQIDAQVQPLVLYSSEIWGYEPHPQIEKAHMSLHAKCSWMCPSKLPMTVYGELGRYLPRVLSMIRCVKYCFRILRQPDKRCSKKAYIILVDLHEKRKTTWSLRIKLLPRQAGFGHVWLYGCGSESIFLKML